jgi:hypothetical protein
MRRFSLYAAAPACLLLGLSPVAAHAGLAPPGTSSATALRVGSLIGVSDTGAEANSGTSNAEASVIDVGGQTVLGLGGTQETAGESGGALVDTGAALPAHVQVAPWEASATGSPTSANRSSAASAAAARATAPGIVGAGVLQSSSEASHQAERSAGAGSSDGADVTLLDALRLVLLHSEVNSQGTGHSYLVGLNGTEIGTDSQLGSTCALNAPGLLSLSCLTASGGGGGGLTSGSAELLGIKSVLSALDPAAAFTASSSSGTGSVPVSILPEESAPAAADESARNVTPAATPTGIAGQATGRLPRTGTAIASLAAAAVAALLTGGALRLLGRRSAAA